MTFDESKSLAEKGSARSGPHASKNKTSSKKNSASSEENAVKKTPTSTNNEGEHKGKTEPIDAKESANDSVQEESVPIENNAATRVSLRVDRAASKDVGRGILRIDPANIEMVGASIGDIVSIKGKRETFARVLPSYMFDRGKGFAFIDGLLRENAQISLGDQISITAAQTRPAISASLIPLTPRAANLTVLQVTQALEGLAGAEGDRVRANVVGAAEADFRILSTNPSGVVVFRADSILTVQEASKGTPRLPVSYEDIGGLGGQVSRIREMIELPLRYPQIFDRLGIEPPKGVLMYGSPGSGKTLIARAVASETAAHFIRINGPEVIHKFYGESEARLRSIFEEAAKKAPTIIFIDEIDAIAPRRAETLGDVEKRVVAQLLALMDGLQARGKVIVIGATNIPDALDPALRRPGRFDREIMIPAPDKSGRLEILQIHTRSMPTDPDVDLTHLAAVTHGFVGADLAALCREAAMVAVRAMLPQMNLGEEAVPFDQLMSLDVKMNDFLAALHEVEPSAIRDILVETPDVSWEQVGGLDGIKQILKESIDWPIKYAPLFAEARVRPPKGILLCGPPGTGKTTLAKALAKESEANFISIKGPALFSKWVGETEKGIRELFRKARQVAPTIIFIDEIDSLAPMRGSTGGDSGVTDRVIAQLLTEMDGLEALTGVVVIAATNRQDMIDPALLRSGRFDQILELPIPNDNSRLEILKIHLRDRPLVDDLNLHELNNLLDGYVGADIESIVNQASILAIRDYLNCPNGSTGRTLKISELNFMEALASLAGRSGSQLGRP
ncbi:MAG TPA: CDC48 family AAA ATPase [Oculatellaceae cyanobacterium]